MFRDLIEYCRYYDLTLGHIVDVMKGLKVVPMIRGMGFEYSAYIRLRKVLSKNDWLVEKPIINAQAEIQDVDILVTNRATNKRITIECKLTAKDSFKLLGIGRARVKVKCMRSRTVGEKASEALARRYGIDIEEVRRHRDNYRDDDFDFVVTSLGNAFWRTNASGEYIFDPTREKVKFLRDFFHDQSLTVEQIKTKAFDYFLIARSSRIKVSRANGVRCVRRACRKTKTSYDCGFIPNYPEVLLHDTSVWTPIENSERLFLDFAS